jgi:hypothetical protein
MKIPDRLWPAFVDGGGNLALEDIHVFMSWLRARYCGKDIDLIVRPRSKPQSRDQRAYWWSVPVEILAEELGYTPNQMHYALLGECFGYREGPAGQAIPNVASLTDLDRAGMTKLIDWVLTWAPSQLSIVIPEPDKNWRVNRQVAS